MGKGGEHGEKERGLKVEKGGEREREDIERKWGRDGAKVG